MILSYFIKEIFPIESQNHRITECLGLEGTSVGHTFPFFSRLGSQHFHIVYPETFMSKINKTKHLPPVFPMPQTQAVIICIISIPSSIQCVIHDHDDIYMYIYVQIIRMCT